MNKPTLEIVNQLYYSEELSLLEVARRKNISPTTLYRFMRKQSLPCRPTEVTNEIIFRRKPLSFRPKENLSPKEQQLKLVGILLCWCEGAKNRTNKNRQVDFANSDLRMCQLFAEFLRVICGVAQERVRAYLYCYANQDASKLQAYWSRLLGVPPSQFTRPYIRKDFDLRKIGHMPHGLVHIRYSDKRLYELIHLCLEEYLSVSMSR